MNGNMQLVSLRNILQEYKEINTENLYRPVAVGKYGIRKREDIYSKELAKDYSKNKIIHEGTLTVGMGSSQIDIGILSSNEIYSVSPAYKTFNIKNINYDYLRYYLEHRNKDMSKRYLLASCRQGKTVDIKRWLDYKVVVYSIETQTKIVDNIDKINDLISKQQKALILLDNLVKSRFIEMFGDVVNNTKNFDVYPLEKLCKKILGGGTPSKSHAEYFLGNIPWITPKDMKNFIINDSIDHITNEAINNSSTKLIPANSVLIVIRSGILKRTFPVAINTKAVTINQDMKAFILSEKILPIYLAMLFKLEEKEIISKIRGVTADNINFNDFKQRGILLPPLESQREFSKFYIRINKSKVEIQKSLDKLEMLKKSLMQQYFG